MPRVTAAGGVERRHLVSPTHSGQSRPPPPRHRLALRCQSQSRPRLHLSLAEITHERHAVKTQANTPQWVCH